MKKIVLFIILFLQSFFSYPHPRFIKILRIGPPKAGTNLANRCIELITGYKPQGFFKSNGLLNIIKKNHFLKAHLGWNNKKRFNSSEFLILNITRDPRDRLISWIFRVHPNPQSNLTSEQINLQINELIRNTNSLYNSFLPWFDEPNVYTVKFEDLIGPKGGGTLEKQLTEIRKICLFLGFPKEENEILDIANNLFGDTITFRKGQIGSWKEHFTKEHIALFKKEAGYLLIKLGYEKNLDW